MGRLAWYSDDPAADADRHYSEQESREHYVCGRCGAYIYKADSLHDADPYCRIDGRIYCKDCIEWAMGEWEKKHREEREENTI